MVKRKRIPVICGSEPKNPAVKKSAGVSEIIYFFKNQMFMSLPVLNLDIYDYEDSKYSNIPYDCADRCMRGGHLPYWVRMEKIAGQWEYLQDPHIFMECACCIGP